MKSKCIGIIYANRAELSILEPVINKFKKQDIMHECINLSDKIQNIELDENLPKIFEFVFSEVAQKIDECLVIGDRRECLFACLALFIKGVPITQLASGDLSKELATVDDFFRHFITIMSNKQIAFSSQAEKLTKNLLSLLNIKQNTIFASNPTLDGINPNELKNKVLFEVVQPYDLVLVHPQSLSESETLKDKEEVASIIANSISDEHKDIIIIKGNKDKHYGILYNYWDELKSHGAKVYDNFEKEDFLSLLKHCDRFITNSSCASYEAPIFLKDSQIVKIGKRNNGRYKAEKGKLNSANDIVNFILS